jgi:uncharacterized protein (TIGR00251 family)
MSLAEPSWLRLGNDYLAIELSVRPAAGKSGIVSVRATGPVIALNSAPEKGRANRELIEFIAELLEVPATAVSIIKGQTARHKVVRVETAYPAAAASKLMDWTGHA